MHLLIWFRDNVLGNFLADLVAGVPAFAIATWRFEKRHKRHQAQIHNQITQEFANLKSND